MLQKCHNTQVLQKYNRKKHQKTVDLWAKVVHNKNMMKRKRRSDRNHAIYELYCDVTGESYIGVTVVTGSALASVRGRFNRHLSRARTESKDWLLCEALRKYGREGFTPYLLEVVRGKAEAHARERELTAEMQPALNTL